MNKYYSVLGLPTNASKDEIRRKYRKLVLIWHPDKNPSPEAHSKFIEITEAYDILSGERKAPRTAFTTKRRTASASPPPPKKKTTKELYREKYLSERARIRRDPNFAGKKSASERRVKMWRILTALPAAGVFVPWFIPQLNVISCGILSILAVQGIMSVGFYAHNLRKQSEMTFGDSDDYDYTAIRDYFLPVHKLRWGRGLAGSNVRYGD
jgi:hypothetical protein